MKNVVVVMPFNAEWSDCVWNALRQLAVKDTSKDTLVSRVAMHETPEELLSDKIEKLNKNANVIVADLTESNPNVLIEVGIALALGTPLLLIAQDSKWIPTHLRGRIVEEYNPYDNNSLKRLSEILLLRMQERLQLAEAQEAKRLQAPIYPVECYSTRTIAKLQEYFRNAKARIDILTTNLSFLFDEYEDGPACYFDDIQTALDIPESKVKLRILTLDPESDFAAKRGRQLGYSPAVFREMLRDSLQRTKKVAHNYPSSVFELRTYDDFPNQITFRIDSTIWHCVVAQPTQSRNYLTFKLDRRQAGVHASFVAHFETVWRTAQGV